MPVAMALDMLGMSEYVTKSKQTDTQAPKPDATNQAVKPPKAASGSNAAPCKLIAARRKSKELASQSVTS